jgi:uncharacterized protein
MRYYPTFLIGRPTLLRLVNLPGRCGTGSRAGEPMVRFDAFDLIARGAHLEGEVDPWTLPRVAEQLEMWSEAPPETAEDGSRIRWRIDGTADASGHPALQLALDGELPLTCQRCLDAFMHPVAQRTRLLVARTEAQLAALDDAGEDEVVLGASPLDALELVEDELLLSLPYAPRHAEGQCPAAEQAGPAAGESAPASPFATLADLKSARGRDRTR